MAFLSPLCQTTQEGEKRREREEKRKRAMHNLLCMTDKGSEHRHLSALLSTSSNRFSDVSICQGPNENMMRRIYGPRGRTEGRGRREARRRRERGRMKGEKIHSVLISGLLRGYIVLGAFYLDVAAARVALVLSPPSVSFHPLCVCVFLPSTHSFSHLLPSKKGESFVSPLFLIGLVFTR